ASHVIGYTGYENVGLSGMELSLDKNLSGVEGRIVRVKNAYGSDMLYTKFEDYIAGQEGMDAVLTIDSSIQYYVEKHLKQAVEDYDIQNGAAAIAMNVNTGEILAMASLGNFDLNDYQNVGDELKQIISEAPENERSALLSSYQQKMWRNKALSDTYEPGSTFKIITLAMALEENAVKTTEHFYCGGSISVIGDGAGRGRKCWKTTGHGDQTLTQCMQHSCNVALIRIGQRVGADKFYEYIDSFGFFDTTGIELGGEAKGLWWSEKVFCDAENLTQLAAASFGQTFTITPLQLIRAVSACVNGGYLVQPHLVDKIIDGKGNIVSENDPEPIRQVISEETSAEIRSILEQVVCDTKEGTGKNAYVAGYKIGGKTGTSTKTVLEAGGVKEYIVSFIGFAPADKPEICILVLLDNPSSSTGQYISGGNMAAPTVGKMFADILPYMGITPVYTEEEKALMDRAVPHLEGLTVEEAQKRLSEVGLDSIIIGEGSLVSETLPNAGTMVAPQSKIMLYTEPLDNIGESYVPELVGMSYTQARDVLEARGLYISCISPRPANSDTMLISSQNIEFGSLVPKGICINVELSDKDESIYGIY
ncbi:MAG: PASTA domain-containing protein, partial [Oscillospiraceae bacterium]|nr:PASTA domain-containing protein [Oscillospiraceae bacterium]